MDLCTPRITRDYNTLIPEDRSCQDLVDMKKERHCKRELLEYQESQS